MNSNPKSEPSESKSPILSIDYRSGSAVMQLGNGERWGAMILNPVEATKLSCSSWTGPLEKLPSALALQRQE